MSDTAGNQAADFGDAGQPDVSHAGLLPGAQLAMHRQARGWTIEEVATQLNLAPRQIQAIEADNYAALPGIASVRGFFRSYAKLLKVDAAPLMAMITGEAANLREPMPPRQALSEPFSDNRLAATGRKTAPSKSLIMAIFCLAVAAAVLGAYQMGWIAVSPESLSTRLSDMTSSTVTPQNAPAPIAANASAGESNNPAGAPAGTPIAPAATAASASSAIASTPVAPAVAEMPAAAASASASTTPGPAAMTAQLGAGKPPQAAAGSPAASLPPALPSGAPAADMKAASKNALVLKPREDTWIQIVRANHTTVFSRLVKAGTTETVEITEPVSMTIGNASGIDVSLRGTPIDLKSSTKNNVVRLNLK